MLNYEEIIPDFHLRHYIRKFWILDNSTSLLPSPEKYALPNTCFTLALIYGEGLILNFHGVSIQIKSGNFMVGELTEKIGVKILPNTKAFMIQLNPWAASLLSKFSFHELTNQFSEIININKSLSQSVKDIDIFDNAATVRQLSKIFENYFCPTPASAFISHCFQLFESHLLITPFKIIDLSSSSGHTGRSIEKKFKQHIGLTPKQAHKILKIRSIINELTLSKNHLSLTDLAYRYGYADQSHFTKTYFQIIQSLPSKFNIEQYILPIES
ncbi:AraC-like DNA-binding protein [Pedobacter sp. UYP30]|uniref:helix-turn-helix domain-containing protein n=1 Tax=Pedobacter sp. UYP30 TaxID=1756400 RepID=UPI00339877ED